jgi:hypothetical protein
MVFAVFRIVEGRRRRVFGYYIAAKSAKIASHAALTPRQKYFQPTLKSAHPMLEVGRFSGFRIVWTQRTFGSVYLE